MQHSNKNFNPTVKKKEKKSSIRETKHVSTDADSSTDAIGGWTKNTPTQGGGGRGGRGVLHYAKPLKYLDWDKAVITRTRFRMG